MTNESKKHHYLPQFVLRRFSIDTKGKQIYVFDKQTEKCYTSSILNSGSENDYNTVLTDTEEFNFEYLFQKTDNLYAELTRKIIEQGSFDGLDYDDFKSLALVTVNQLRRTKLERSTMDYVNREIYNTIEKAIKDLKGHYTNGHERLTSEEIKAFSIMGVFDTEEEIRSLLTMGIYLIKNRTGLPFLISDTPVVFDNNFDYGGLGIFEKGIEIYLPISPEYLVGFCCPTIINKLQIADNLGTLDIEATKFLRALEEDHPLILEDLNHVKYYNSLQVLKSYRFIYSTIDVSSLVKGIISHNPKIKFNETTVRLGEMGKGPPPNKNLPMGDLLIIFGNKDHNMLPVKIISASQEKVEFKCEKSFLLSTVLADIPYERAEWHCDQSLRWALGKPEINIIDQANDLYELTYSDKKMFQVFEMIRNEKKKKEGNFKQSRLRRFLNFIRIIKK
ncbi:DUF4238 domain-containing protein [Flavobacterium sp. F-65]|uniref:DUF4238 domain-containing protein n=1 Tax=Flavobacterium pisciphilum TaxID=2893755 RepID=A0ABS8MXP8_9FLAO|nr:DUF4238 domain-containing protein [Flavobacterium sp. F-65]MCC9073555.1 DUF4238 domain-containing protein [Flavobacterium sp. F-65]